MKILALTALTYLRVAASSAEHIDDGMVNAPGAVETMVAVMRGDEGNKPTRVAELACTILHSLFRLTTIGAAVRDAAAICKPGPAIRTRARNAGAIQTNYCDARAAENTTLP